MAVLSLVARTATKSVTSGNGTRRHDRPSVDRRTVPRAPTIQQTVGAGDAPAASGASAPVRCVSHVDPPSTDR